MGRGVIQPVSDATPRQQMSIDFVPGLLEQFPDWMDCLRASVYNCGKPFKVIAADCDMSVSELSRRLGEHGDIPFPLDKLDVLLGSINDPRPVQWLVLKHMGDPSTVTQRAIRDIAALAPTMIALAAKAGLLDTTSSTKPRGR